MRRWRPRESADAGSRSLAGPVSSARHLDARLRAAGHETSSCSRRTGSGLDVGATAELAAAFRGCEAVVHCAGINRELGAQTYEAVHVRGTAAVIEAARAAGVPRIVMLSFLRARPDGPTTYHRSKWAAEELVRASGLTYTILKAGVIYGRGDHMLDHLSHAFHTFPVFGLVGLRDRPVRPVAVDDVARILEAAALGERGWPTRRSRSSGPEAMPLGEAVRRVARATGRRPLFVRLPVAAHLVDRMASAELTMRVPLISTAQVHILAEGVVEPLPFAPIRPGDLVPRRPSTVDVDPARPARAGRLRLPRPPLARRHDRSFELETVIDAPIELVFDLARDIGLHERSMAATGERAIAGRMSGAIEQGETVTWRARHFGLWWTMTSRITEVQPPTTFADRQEGGPFAWFRHRHTVPCRAEAGP